MTVQALIENLKSFPQDSEVLLTQYGIEFPPFVACGVVCNMIVGERGFVTLHCTNDVKVFAKGN